MYPSTHRMQHFRRASQCHHAYQLPRSVMMAALATLGPSRPSMPHGCHHDNGSVNVDYEHAKDFPYTMGAVVCARRADYIGARLVFTEPDGNCMTRAMSVVCYGTEENHATMRIIYTSVVLTSPDIQAFIPGFDRTLYMNDHFTPGRAWGGNVELEALGRALGLSIFLIQDHRDVPVIEVCNHGSASCCLAYRGGNHYDVIGFPAPVPELQGRAQGLHPPQNFWVAHPPENFMAPLENIAPPGELLGSKKPPPSTSKVEATPPSYIKFEEWRAIHGYSRSDTVSPSEDEQMRDDFMAFMTGVPPTAKRGRDSDEDL